ncbi:MAG: beta-N-acetylglucosaminidase domain-containing protein, partial [Defluviitoga tunisiensis]|nr:beta-N-acetylglucosaminidase domain-containing protein [Defluviitoga tunisiensis]
FCPTEYWQKEDSPYRRTLKDNLNPEILVIWTGNGVWSKRVSRKNANEISNQFGHKLVLWDNYPVNDADEGKLFLGPLTNREVDLYKSIEGVIANPMNQAYASLIALQTISDYLWNSESYNPWISWEKAIFNVAGGELSSELKLFSENFLKSRLFEGTSFKLKRLLKNYKEDSLNASKELVSYLEELSNLDEELSKIGFKGFYEDIKPWVAKLSELSRIVIKLITSPESEKDLIKREGEIRIKEYENISVCDDILDIFIKEI